MSAAHSIPNQIMAYERTFLVSTIYQEDAICEFPPGKNVSFVSLEVLMDPYGRFEVTGLELWQKTGRIQAQNT